MSAKPKHTPNGKTIGGKKSPAGNAIDRSDSKGRAENEERDLANLVGLEPIETTEDEEEIYLELEELVDLPEGEPPQEDTADYSASQDSYDMESINGEESADGYDETDFEEEPDVFDGQDPDGEPIDSSEYIDQPAISQETTTEPLDASPKPHTEHHKYDNRQYREESSKAGKTQSNDNEYEDTEMEYQDETWENGRDEQETVEYEEGLKEYFNEIPISDDSPETDDYQEDPRRYQADSQDGRRVRPEVSRLDEVQRERYQEVPERRRARPATERYDDGQDDYYEESPEVRRAMPEDKRFQEDQRDYYQETSERRRARPAVERYDDGQDDYYPEAPVRKRTRPAIERYDDEQGEYYREPVSRRKAPRREPYPKGDPRYPDDVPQRRPPSRARPLPDQDYQQETRQPGPVRPDRRAAGEKYDRNFPESGYVRSKARPGREPLRENGPHAPDEGLDQGPPRFREEDRPPGVTRGIDRKAIDEHLEEVDSFEEELSRKKERKRKASVFKEEAPSAISMDQAADDVAEKPDLAATEIGVVDVTSGLWMDNPDRFIGIMENLRLVKNKITSPQQNNSGKGVQHKTFMFTGAGRKVGASTLLANLGIVFARDLIDRRMLLVDANILNPSVHQLFNIPQQPGIMDYLLKNYPLNHILKQSQHKNLDLITIGEVVHEVSSPFELKRFTEFLAEVSKVYDFVLVDAAPPLQSSHSRILSTRLDGVIIVAESNATRWEVLLELRNQLEKDGANLVGGILNKRRFVIPKWVYRFF